MAMDAGAWWMGKFPAADLFNVVPAGMSAMESLLWNIEGGGLDLVREMLGDYVEIFPAWFTPPEAFLSSTKPINSNVDLAKLRIRTAGGGIDGIAFAKMGASIVSIPGPELYESVQRGVIDAFQYGSPALDIEIATYEVIKYMYLSPVRQPTDFLYYVVNPKSWAALPDDLKALVQDAFLLEGLTYYMTTTTDDAIAIEKYKGYGVVVEPMAVEVEQLLIEVADEVYAERSAKDPFIAKVVESQRQYKEKIRGLYERL